MDGTPDNFADDLFQMEEQRQRYVEICARFEGWLEARGETLTRVTQTHVFALAAYYELEQMSTLQAGAADAIRKEVERMLWKYNLFREPWTTLVADAFSGEGLTKEEIEALPTIGDEAEAFMTWEAELASEVDRCVSFLTARDVQLSEDDRRFIILLVQEKHIRQTLGLPIREEALIELHNTKRTEQPWFDLIERRF